MNYSMGSGTLAAEDVGFGYLVSQPVIEGWSARFYPGSVTAMTGPSGAGKSTLLYLLGLLLQPSSGRILVDGLSMTGLRDADLALLRARRFGFVFQDAALDSTRTVFENVTEAAVYRGESRTASLPRVLQLLDRFGVDVPVDRKPNQVSGGQAQRISLCRALLNMPQFLLADEPTGNLDSDTSALVIEALHNHARAGNVVIVVTHSLEVASSCDEEVSL